MFYQRNENYILRKIHDTYFFINITDKYNDDKCQLIETNDVGEFVWAQLEQPRDIEEIVHSLIEIVNEEVDFKEVYEDIKNYLEGLNSKGIVYRRA